MQVVIIREPLVHATYYYLREAPGDSPTHRHHRHEEFVSEAHRLLQAFSGWLAIPTPALPSIPIWEADPPDVVQPLTPILELQGHINASAWLAAYVLRNMLLLRVVVARAGDHDQNVWSMLDASLGVSPTAPSWLHTVRYWCGIAPRPPEDLEQERLLPVRAPFGVLCLGQGNQPHVLVYPDARTEGRASFFLKSLATQLDWYMVQAYHRLDEYEHRAAGTVPSRRQALERVSQAVQEWSVPGGSSRLRSLAPLHSELDKLETTYQNTLGDLADVESAAQDVRSLMSEYRLMLMQSGLWDAAPNVWEAQVSRLAGIQAQIEADARHLESTLRWTELMLQGVTMRLALLQGERERLLVYLVVALGLAILAVLIADTNLGRVAVRLLALGVVAGMVWAGWQSWLRSHWR